MAESTSVAEKETAGIAPRRPKPLCVNQILIHDFHCPVPDIVYPLHPKHLILRLELMIRWAESKLGSTEYAGWCLAFIEDALELSNLG